MTFYDRYEQLCSEHGMRPQTPEMLEISGVTSGSVSGWKKGALPKAEALCRLAAHFHVTTDYLLGLSEVRNPQTITLTDHEMLLLKAFRAADAEGQQNIIFTCQYEMRKAEKGESVNAG